MKDGYDVVWRCPARRRPSRWRFKCVPRRRPHHRVRHPAKKVEIDWANDLIFKGVRVHGIVGRQIFETWYKADRLLRSGAIDLRPVMTHTFPLKDFKKGFEVMSAADKKCGKVLLIP